MTSFLPFEPRACVAVDFGSARLQVWPLRGEGDGRDGNVMDGWIDREGRAVARSVADAQEIVRTRAGEFAVINVSEDGDVLAFCDFLGARHIYFRQQGDRIAISNRALLAAGAFGSPEIEPIEMAWFMASIACPFTENTAWRGVKILEAGDVLHWNGTAQIHPTEIEAEAVAWDELWDELCERMNVLVSSRAPNRMALTGGKDSRLVLAGAIGSASLPRFDHAYLRGCDELADVKVGRQLSERYGLSFRAEPVGLVEGEPESVIDRHNFQTEHHLHCWDLKGYDVAPGRRGFHGNYGEIFRSHSLPRFALGWREVRRKYLSDGYLDLYDVMTPDAVAHVRRGTQAWLERKLDEGVPPLKLHDRMHRAARMQRWVGHTSQVDGFLGGSVNPLVSPRLLANYLALPLVEQKVHRTHFELIRRADDWLWRQPFANASWSRLVAPRWVRRPKPVQNGATSTSRQLEFWSRNSAAIAAIVTARDASSFDELFDRNRVGRLVAQTQKDPTPYRIRAVLGLAGVRRSLVAPAQRFVVEIEETS